MAEPQEDRITDLPDPICRHILSLLSTKDRIVAASLSSNWKLLCSSLPFLQFRLQCRQNHPVSVVHTWISDAIDRQIPHIDLNFAISEPLELPLSLFKSDSLVSLILNPNIVIDLKTLAAASISLPNLKILHLNSIRYKDDDEAVQSQSMVDILSACPELEELVIRRFAGDNLWTLRVVSPKLKRLTIDFAKRGVRELKTVVDAPALEFLNIRDHMTQTLCVLSTLSSVTRASIDVGRCFPQEDARVLVAILARIYNVSYLQLHCYAMEALSRCYDSDFPCYHNLTHLEVTLKHSGWKALVFLVKNSPNLRVFVMDKEHLSFRARAEISECYWQLPDVLSSSIEEFEMRGYRGLRDDVFLVRKVLKKAKVLKKVTLRCSDDDSYSEDDFNSMKEELLQHPITSPGCQLSIF